MFVDHRNGGKRYQPDSNMNRTSNRCWSRCFSRHGLLSAWRKHTLRKFRRIANRELAAYGEVVTDIRSLYDVWDLF